MTLFAAFRARRLAFGLVCAFGALVVLILLAALSYGFAQQHVERQPASPLTCSTTASSCSALTTPTPTTSPTPGDAAGQVKSSGAAASAATASHPSAHVSVSISNFAFTPGVLHVHTGTTVTWTNHDTVAHTVTFYSGGGSGMLGHGRSYSRTFTKPGTYDYFCAVHPDMTGRVVVTG